VKRREFLKTVLAAPIVAELPAPAAVVVARTIPVGPLVVTGPNTVALWATFNLYIDSPVAPLWKLA
jgi:hypothetical protein